MIKIKIKGPNTLPDIVNYQERQFPLNIHRIWVGRGEQLSQKQTQNNSIINLNDFSESVSRIHACFILSPAFYSNHNSIFPSYFHKFKSQWGLLPDNLYFQIWSFLKPPKAILLKDMHSKMGIFSKISSITIKTDMQLVFGDSRPLIFHHQQKYQNTQQMNQNIEELKQKGYIELKTDQKLDARSFWILSYKNQFFILRNQKAKLYIGRSNACQIVIAQGVVSRKHATLQYYNGHWTIIDGDGVTASRNGLWKRLKKIMLNCQVQNQTNYCLVSKVAEVMLTMEVKLEYSFLNVEQLCQETNNALQTNFMSQLQEELKQQKEKNDCYRA